MKAVAAGLVTLAGIASADVVLYGQCGGINYTGETTCVAGAHCQYVNDYYSQCLAGMVFSFTYIPTLPGRGRKTRVGH